MFSNYNYFIILLITFSAINIISINSQGLRSTDRRQTAFNFFKRHKYDIIFLQETHWTNNLQSIIQQNWDGDIYFSNGTDNARGVAILIHANFDYILQRSQHDSHGRILSIEICTDETTINLVNIYAPRTDSERRQFFQTFDSYLSTNHDNILGGDFNTISDPRLDKLGGNPEARHHANKTLTAISSRFTLIDIWRHLHKNKRNFTWTGRNPTDNSLIRTRIDKYLTSRNLSPKIITASIQPYPHSDHDAITLSLNLTDQPRGDGFWHFNNSLLQDPIFTDDIQSFWQEWLLQKNTFDNPLIWWDKAKQNFKRIAIHRSTTLRKTQRNERYQLERSLHHLQQKAANGNSTDIEHYLTAKEKLKQFELTDLEAIKIRTKARFLEEGEKSTRYFYSLEKKQKNNHTIKTLTRDNFDTITDTRAILTETHNFYKTLYTAEPTDRQAQNQLFHSYPIPQLPDTERTNCDASLTEQELYKALNSMENNKSPGIDGLSTNFYKHFWHTFSSALTSVYNYAFKHGTLTVTQRQGIITLLFKKGDRTKLKNWRPITLLTTDYKILTKALANRLKNVLHLLISTDQTACIPGRTINDNISLIRDAIHFANESNTPLAMISIDQLKAFDRVSHSFLLQTLNNFGFGPNFTQWIKTIYNAVSSSVKVNGWLTAFIPLGRGLRQGCALSMPLYILTAEILAITIRASTEIKGLRPPNSTTDVKLSQYADDTTLLLKDTSSITHTFSILNLYERASGAKINRDKCKGLWSGSLKHRTDNLMDFDWFNDFIPDKILGHFFGNTDCNKRNLEPRIQKIKTTIEAWQHRDLSFKGKSLVINGLLTSTLWYTATSTHMPIWAISEIENLIYNFFWNNKRPLTTRDILALPTAEGGHNIHRLKPKIEALRLNTLRRLLDPEPAHWKSLTEHFLRTSNMPLGRLTLATTFLPRHIDNNLPTYHQELLRAWAKHEQFRTRTDLPTSYMDILQEPLFKSNLILHNDAPIYYKNWIDAGLLQVRDLCYLAIPGLLPIPAIHEILHNNNDTQTIQKTFREYRTILQALPPHWLHMISYDSPPSTTTHQPSFIMTNHTPGKPPISLTNGKTRIFYLQLMKDRATTIPALNHWNSTLIPRPTFNKHRWKSAYPPLAPNKLGDTNWKIIHRILPTAQSLYRMTVHPTPNCHRCGFTESVDHLILHCPHVSIFWQQVQHYTGKLTENRLQLSNTIKLFGYLRSKDDPLSQYTINLLNWILTVARHSIHRSAVEYRLRNSTVLPSTLFCSSVKSHLTEQYKLHKSRMTTYLFPFIWCIHDAIAKVSNGKLVFTL